MLFLEDQLSTSNVFVASIAKLNFQITDALPEAVEPEVQQGDIAACTEKIWCCEKRSCCH